MTDNPFDVDYVEPTAPAEEVQADPKRKGSITYHPNLIQGSDEWLQARCGILTASEMGKILTPKLKVADNKDTRIHAFEIAFQRITGYVEPQYVSDAMLRGQEDEIYAREAYREYYAEVTETGFVTNDSLGFTIGYSPDGLVGDDGLIEAKSRCGKYHVQTIAANEVPDDYILQLQTGLWVTRRKWIDFISYCGGLPVFVKRMEPIAEYQEAIEQTAIQFEQRVQTIIQEYRSTLAGMAKIIPTERREYQEIIV